MLTSAGTVVALVTSPLMQFRRLPCKVLRYSGTIDEWQIAALGRKKAEVQIRVRARQRPKQNAKNKAKRAARRAAKAGPSH